MPIRVNDPKSLEDWIVKTDQRLRELEARRLDAADGLTQDHATKQMAVKVSDDPNNSAAIGSDGGVYAADTVTSAADHTPLLIQQFMTASATITNAADTLIVWSSSSSTGTWTSTTSTITIPEDGWYHVNVAWPWTNNATGTRAIHVTLNSTTVATGSTMAGQCDPANGETACLISDYRQFAAGDVLRVYAFQNSGGNLTGGTPYFGDVRGRWTVVKVHDSYPPELTTATDTTTTA